MLRSYSCSYMHSDMLHHSYKCSYMLALEGYMILQSNNFLLEDYFRFVQSLDRKLMTELHLSLQMKHNFLQGDY